MSEPNQIDINSLHQTVLRETENDSILEIDQNFYRNLSDFIGNLRKQEFDGVESKIKDTLIEMATERSAPRSWRLGPTCGSLCRPRA